MPLCEEKTITEARTMDKSELIEKLKKMRLPVIAEQYELQSASPEYSQLSFDERFSELIDMEYDSRVNHTIERFIKNAHFYDSTASMESINYNPDRKLDRSQMSIPWWRSHPIHKNRATESIWTEPCNPLLRAAKSTKRATFNL